MTREEAIDVVESFRNVVARMENTEYTVEALDMAISALRPVSREQVERMRGEWIWYGEEVHCSAGNFPIKKCKQCKKEMLLDDYDNFCPACGAPMTDEAVEMVMERLEAMKDAD